MARSNGNSHASFAPDLQYRIDFDIYPLNLDRLAVCPAYRRHRCSVVTKATGIRVKSPLYEHFHIVIGEDNLMVGSDYTHRDPSMELEFRKELEGRADKGDIPKASVQKILYDNPKAFYAL